MKSFFIPLVFTLFMAPPVFAEGPCAKDRETHCQGVEHGEGRVMKCMKENEAKLSAECKAHMAKNKAQMKEVKEACHADAEKVCPDLRGRKLMKCMKDNQEKLSEGCKSEWKEAKASHKRVH